MRYLVTGSEGPGFASDEEVTPLQSFRARARIERGVLREVKRRRAR